MVERFVAKGATAATPVELGATCDLVLVVVGTADDVRRAVIASGLLDAMRPGVILVIHSSIAPDAVCAVAAEAAAHGVHCLDAPVSGGRARSYAGELTILVGGEAVVLDAARPVLDTYSAMIAKVRPIGSGQLGQGAQQLLLCCATSTAAKMIELISAHGVDSAR